MPLLSAGGKKKRREAVTFRVTIPRQPRRAAPSDRVYLKRLDCNDKFYGERSIKIIATGVMIPRRDAKTSKSIFCCRSLQKNEADLRRQRRGELKAHNSATNGELRYERKGNRTELDRGNTLVLRSGVFNCRRQRCYTPREWVTTVPIPFQGLRKADGTCR